jgi:hypothetical protein
MSALMPEAHGKFVLKGNDVVSMLDAYLVL